MTGLQNVSDTTLVPIYIPNGSICVQTCHWRNLYKQFKCLRLTCVFVPNVVCGFPNPVNAEEVVCVVPNNPPL